MSGDKRAIDVRGGICGQPLFFGDCETHGKRSGMTNNTERIELAELVAVETNKETSGFLVRCATDGETPVFEADERIADAILAAGYRKPDDAVRAALHHAADVMPIETLLGADKASVWLREYAEKWGKR